MNSQMAAIYVCPVTRSPLQLDVCTTVGDGVVEGSFHNTTGATFPIADGIPDFIWPRVLQEADERTRQSYEDMAQDYDRYAVLPFITYRADEDAVRERMVDRLELQTDSKVLEIGCGTGRGAEHLARRLGESGQLYLQELSPKLLA